MVDQGDSPGPEVRTIVIVGTTGREKIISEQLEGSIKEKIISEQLDGSKKGEVVCKTRIFESFGSTFDQDALKHLKEVHLVLFVIESGRITGKTFDNINIDICKRYPCVSKISALLLVGCEGKSYEARQEIVNGFRRDTYTKDVVEFMQQGIYAVGFPDISEADPSFKEKFTEGMTTDAECLHKMVMNQNSSVDLGEIFSKSEGQSTQELTQLPPEPTQLRSPLLSPPRGCCRDLREWMGNRCRDLREWIGNRCRDLREWIGNRCRDLREWIGNCWTLLVACLRPCCNCCCDCCCNCCGNCSCNCCCNCCCN